MEDKSDKEFDQIDLLEIIRFVTTNRKKIIIGSIFIVLASVVVSLVLTPKYKIEAIIAPAEATEENSMGISSSLSNFSLFGGLEPEMHRQIRLNLTSYDFRKQIYDKYKDEDKLFEDLNDINDPLEKQYEAFEQLKDKLRISYRTKDATYSVHAILEDREFALEFLNDVLFMLKEFIKKRNKDILHEDIEHFIVTNNDVQDPMIKIKFDQILKRKIEKYHILTSNVFSILESPYIPYKRYFPKRKIIVLVSTFCAPFLIILLLLVKGVYIKLINVYKSRYKNIR